MPYGYYSYYFDPTYIMVIVGFIICAVASARVNSTYRKYSRYRSTTGMTGAQAAMRILSAEGITDVSVQHIAGNLTDNYDPRTKTVNLSDATYASDSVAAIGVAAHECGHVMQHAKGYLPLSIRTALVPVANIGSKIGIPICILGLLLGSNSTLIDIGIWIFSLAVLFQLVTLPVEFNASHRALVLTGELGILNEEEVRDTRKVLGAAAMTYVAGALASLLQLFRVILLFGGGRRRD